MLMRNPNRHHVRKFNNLYDAMRYAKRQGIATKR